MKILAFFTDEGTPKTGLSPTIRIRDVADNSLIITDAATVEVGDGWYKYDFTTYDGAVEYAIRFDGGAVLADIDRYTFGANELDVNLIADTIWDEAAADHLAAGSFGAKNQRVVPSETLNDYKATGFNTVVPDAAGVAPTAPEIRVEMDTNSSRLDANISSRAPASEYDTEMTRITANVATETKQDIMYTNIDQIETAVITNAVGVDVAADIAALNDISVPDVQTALSAQGYTTTRAALLDNLDATISGVRAALVVVQADLDNPDQYKASVGLLALEASLQEVKTKTDLLKDAWNDPAATVIADAVLDRTA